MQVIINEKSYDFEIGETILDVARKNKIEIPTLCYLKNIIGDSNCRICMVENTFNQRLVPACSTKCYDGLSVITNSPRVVKSRKDTLKLILSNHHKKCDECAKHGACTLEKLFKKYKIIEQNKPEFEKQNFQIDSSSPCIIRNNNKCVLCGRCVSVCKNTQAVDAITKQKRGFSTFVGCAFNKPLECSTCVGCGQCTLVCPTGALLENSEIDEVEKHIADPNKFVVAQVAPSVRVSLAEYFNNPIGTFDEGRMVTALKMLGFDKVFDVNMGADFTVVEESEELLERIKQNKNLPLFSSCCPAWFKYVNTFYPNHTSHLSTCKSPTEMLGALIKNYYAKKENIDPNNIIVVGIMPCTAKKGEKLRGHDVDQVLTTREVAKLIEKHSINYNNLEKSEFDKPLSSYSGAGLIFGATGGVTEAVLRCVSRKLENSDDRVDFVDVRHGEGRKEVKVKCGKTELKLCVVSGLKNAKAVMDDIVSGAKKYDFVEVMACPGGCVNGGGQNYVDYSHIDVEDVKKLRANSLYNKDKEMGSRLSDQNADLKQIYADFFIPSPKLAKQILHYKH